jgi:hypothetical protein
MLRTAISLEPSVSMGATTEPRRSVPAMPHADRLERVRAELLRLGYGGDVRPALITYLAATTRVLTMRPGDMPCHLLLMGAPSTGKSWTLTLTLALLPPDEAYVRIDAASPRVLLYDKRDLRHRVLAFSEVDSLPARENNPAASALRTLLQDGHVAYDVVRPDRSVEHIEKEGPTTLLATATKRLGGQLDTRLLTVELADDRHQLHAVLERRARGELEPPREPNPALVAFQWHLQAAAPWDVIVPFAMELSTRIAALPSAPRVTRDFSRLLSLIKAAAVLRHESRQREGNGRLVAEPEDYATVHSLVADLYAVEVTRAAKPVREVVDAVRGLHRDCGRPVSLTEVAGHLRIAKSSASVHVNTALQEGWLVAANRRHGRAYELTLGEPLPSEEGLPRPEDIF